DGVDRLRTGIAWQRPDDLVHDAGSRARDELQRGLHADELVLVERHLEELHLDQDHPPAAHGEEVLRLLAHRADHQVGLREILLRFDLSFEEYGAAHRPRLDAVQTGPLERAGERLRSEPPRARGGLQERAYLWIEQEHLLDALLIVGGERLPLEDHAVADGADADALPIAQEGPDLGD